MTLITNQWKNLAASPAHAEAKAGLQKWLPTSNAEHFRGGDGKDASGKK